MSNASATDDLDIHEVRFWFTNLNENNTYYDQVIAAPRQEHRRIQWTMWLATASFVSIFVGVVFLSIVSNPYIRFKSFNVFLICLMIPDFLFSFLCTINCILNLVADDFFSIGWCHFQSFYCIWGICANAWLNAVVAYHMHQMLICSNNRRRYFPPRVRGVILSALGAYTWAFFVAIWPMVGFLPHKTGLLAGLACFPVTYDGVSVAYFFLVFFPCFALIPLIYVVYVWASVVRGNLLPKRGKTRHLAVYFFRLILVFIIMWLPSLLLLFGTSGLLHPWFMGVGGSWSHLQGAVSAACSITKPDIRTAVISFLCCRKPKFEDYPLTQGSSRFSISRKSSTRISTVSSRFSRNSGDSFEEASRAFSHSDHVESMTVKAETLTEQTTVKDSATQSHPTRALTKELPAAYTKAHVLHSGDCSHDHEESYSRSNNVEGIDEGVVCENNTIRKQMNDQGNNKMDTSIMLPSDLEDGLAGEESSKIETSETISKPSIILSLFHP